MKLTKREVLSNVMAFIALALFQSFISFIYAHSESQPTAFKIPDAEVCLRDQNQGNYSTCHAFCTGCTMKVVYSRSPKVIPGRLSMQWITMLSMAKKLCDSEYSERQSFDTMINQGWFAHENLALLSQVGVCNEESYHEYDPNLSYSEIVEDWFLGFFARNGKGTNRRPDREDSNWYKQFGISSKHAYDLFCPKRNTPLSATFQRGNREFLKKLEQLSQNGQISKKFYRCAHESLLRAEALRGRQLNKGIPNCDKTIFSNNPVTQLKNALKNENLPIPISIKTGAGLDGAHCISVIGWDSKGFITINSWGNDTTYDHIPYDKANEALLRMYLPSNCGIAKGGNAAEKNDSRRSLEGDR
ncbi:MAG: hypothetical protein KDD61_11260 [Bdellovibrionales bacterium]|nr:hypothetical protein [Bdellovibrionales bacterium]